MEMIVGGGVDRLALFEYSRASRDRLVNANLFARQARQPGPRPLFDAYVVERLAAG
jgi:hypothetical protein